MSGLRSIQLRLALAISLAVTLLWIAAATATATLLRHEMDEVFDSALQETAQRLLPLAVMDIVAREEEGLTQELATLRTHDEFFTYVVRDAQGRALLTSHAADPGLFPAFDGVGFRDTATHRLYFDAALQETITIAVAEPLDHRAGVAREMRMALALPLLLVIPLSVAAILLAVRLGFRPLRRLRDALSTRGAADLSPVPGDGLPGEVAPIAGAVNQLLGRLGAAFEAERSFAANAAHELRTPLAGALAQAQRLQSETSDPGAAERAAEIETTLKRLTRLSEKLMQLARAEGGPLRKDSATDLRPILKMVAGDAGRAEQSERVALSLPETAVMSDMDPDAFAILARNLIENALKHGARKAPVAVALSPDGRLSVANDGPLLAPETLERLTGRFERAEGHGEGSGLGLAIVRTIAERAQAPLTLTSPAPGRTGGLEVAVDLACEPFPA